MFGKELDGLLSKARADIACTSMKDVPTGFQRLGIASFVTRETSDALYLSFCITRTFKWAIGGHFKFAGVVAIKNAAPRFIIKDLRGKRNTRLRKNGTDGEYWPRYSCDRGISSLEMQIRIRKGIPCPKLAYPQVAKVQWVVEWSAPGWRTNDWLLAPSTALKRQRFRVPRLNARLSIEREVMYDSVYRAVCLCRYIEAVRDVTLNFY